MKLDFTIALVALFAALRDVNAFAPSCRGTGQSLQRKAWTEPSFRWTSTSLAMSAAAPPPPPPPPGDGKPPKEETELEYTGSVDWDAEWKKVVKSQQSGGGTGAGLQPQSDLQERPGKGYYKSEAEIAAIRAANAATEKAAKLASGMPSLPRWDAVKGDWKFWIGILAVVSVGLSVLSAVPSGPSTSIGSADSYYI